MKRKIIKKCKHPYTRLYSVIIKNYIDPELKIYKPTTILWTGCCACGEPLGYKIIKEQKRV